MGIKKGHSDGFAKGEVDGSRKATKKVICWALKKEKAQGSS